MKLSQLLVVVLFLASCSAQITSNKAKDFNKRISKFYAIVKTGTNSGKFDELFYQEFKTLLDTRGVEITFEAISPISLDNQEDIAERILESGADGLLKINLVEQVIFQNNGSYYGGGGVGGKTTSGSFDIQLFIPGSSRPVWRALLKSTAHFGAIASTAKVSANEIYEQMIKDGII